jgi:glycosyltransferase involved in cell wall biosynthesis
MTAASVIIATRNKARYLELTLASFALQTERDYEVIVLDDGSSDDTADVARRAASTAPVRYVAQPHGGRAAARNCAVAEANGRVIIFSDDDRIVAPGFVAAHVARCDASPTVQVFGWQRGILSIWNPGLQLPLPMLWTWWAKNGSRIRRPDAVTPMFSASELVAEFDGVINRYEIPERWWVDGVVPALAIWGDDLATMTVPWVLGTTGNLSVRREALLAVGGFDDGFVGWGLEDLDLCYRLHHAGYRPVVDRDAVSWHQAHPTGARKRSEWLRNLVYLIEKHDALDLTLYARELTQNRNAEWARLDATVRDVLAEATTPALRRALRQTLLALITRRVRALEDSGFTYFLGVSQADW